MSDVAPPTDQAVPVKPFRTVGILGAGRAGAELAHWCSLSGYGVILYDGSREAIQQGVAMIRDLFAGRVKRGLLSPEEAHKMTGGIGITTSLEDFEICDLVIEAIPEEAPGRMNVFAELSARVDPDCVLATVHTARSLAETTAGAAGPERIIGLRFASPIERQSPLAMTTEARTSPTIMARMRSFAEKMNLVPVT